MNTQDPTPKIKLISTLMDRSPERHPDHPWQKEIAELRYDLQYRDGYTASVLDVAKALAISPQDVRDLQNGGKTTTPEGWAIFEAAVRAEHAKAGAERAARAQGLRMAAPMLAIAALVLALAGLGCGPSSDPESKCDAAGGTYECDGIIRPDGGEHCFCDMSKAE